MKTVNATKPWQTKFFDCKNIEPRSDSREVLELPKHGINLKGKKDAAAHRRKSNRAK